MPALEAGATAPDISLPTIRGERFSLAEARRRGPVVLAFFKVNCPTCQYAAPFIERLYQANKSGDASIVGVSQNSERDTAAFMKEYGLTLPVLLDDVKSYPASNAYGLTNVPTLFLIGTDGKVEFSSVGWAKSDFEEIYRRLNGVGSAPAHALFRPGEQVAAFKSG